MSEILTQGSFRSQGGFRDLGSGGHGSGSLGYNYFGGGYGGYEDYYYNYYGDFGYEPSFSFSSLSNIGRLFRNIAYGRFDGGKFENASNPNSSYSGFDYYHNTGCCDCQDYLEAYPYMAAAPQTLSYLKLYYPILVDFYTAVINLGTGVDPQLDILTALKDFYSSIANFLAGYDDRDEVFLVDAFTGQDWAASLFDSIQNSRCRDDHLDSLATMCMNHKIADSYIPAFEDGGAEGLMDAEGDPFGDMYDCLAEYFETSIYNLTLCDYENMVKIKSGKEMYMFLKMFLSQSNPGELGSKGFDFGSLFQYLFDMYNYGGYGDDYDDYYGGYYGYYYGDYDSYYYGGYGGWNYGGFDFGGFFGHGGYGGIWDLFGKGGFGGYGGYQDSGDIWSFFGSGSYGDWGNGYSTFDWTNLFGDGIGYDYSYGGYWNGYNNYGGYGGYSDYKDDEEEDSGDENHGMEDNPYISPYDWNNPWDMYTIPQDFMTIYTIASYFNGFPKEDEFRRFSFLIRKKAVYTETSALQSYYDQVGELAMETARKLNDLYNVSVGTPEYLADYTCCQCLSEIIIYGIRPSNYYADFEHLNYLQKNLFTIEISNKKALIDWVIVDESEETVPILSGEKLDIFIPANTLSADTSYLIYIKAKSRDGDDSASTTVRIRTGIPPSGGSFTCNETSVTAVKDGIRLETSGWTGSEPLSYYFIYFTDPDDLDLNDPLGSKKGYFDIEGNSTETTYDTVMPNIRGPEGTTAEMLVGVLVVDRYGMGAVKTAQITVTKYKATADEISNEATKLLAKDFTFSEAKVFSSYFDFDDEDSIKSQKSVVNIFLEKLLDIKSSNPDFFSQAIDVISSFTEVDDIIDPSVISSTAGFFKAQLSDPSVQFTVTVANSENMFKTIGNLAYAAPADTISEVVKIPDLLMKYLGSNLDPDTQTKFITKGLSIIVASASGTTEKSFDDSNGTYSSSEFKYPGIPAYDVYSTVNFGFKAWNVDILPEETTSTLTNYISLDIYVNGADQNIKDLTNPIQVVQYVQNEDLPSGDNDTFLGYINEKTRELEYEGCNIVSKEAHNSTHTKVTAEVNHLTTFTLSSLPVGDSEFSWSKVRIVYVVITLGLFSILAGMTLMLTKPSAKVQAENITNHNLSERDMFNTTNHGLPTQAQYAKEPPKENTWVAPQRGPLSCGSSFKTHHSLISLFYKNSRARKSTRVATFMVRWFMMTLASTVIFWIIKTEEFNIITSAWVSAAAFVVGFAFSYILKVLVEAKKSTGLNAIITFMCLAYIGGSTFGIMSLNSKHGKGFNDAVFYSFFIQFVADVLLVQPVKSLVMMCFSK